MRQWGSEDRFPKAGGACVFREFGGVCRKKVEEDLGSDLLKLVFRRHPQERREAGEIRGLMSVGEPTIKKITVRTARMRSALYGTRTQRYRTP